MKDGRDVLDVACPNSEQRRDLRMVAGQLSIPDRLGVTGSAILAYETYDLHLAGTSTVVGSMEFTYAYQVTRE